MIIEFMCVAGPYFEKPAGTGSGGGSGDEDSLSHDLADLDDDVQPDKTPKTEKEEEDEEVETDEEELEGDDEEESEEEEEESEDEEESEEDEEEEKPEKEVKTASFKDIKTKYPNIFKEYPQLKSAFFLAPKFLEIFPDPESAQDAATKAEEYGALEATLVGEGNAKLLLSTLSENNPKALRKIVESFGETLREVSGEDYTALSIPIIEELLYHAAAHGTKTGNKNLELAAKHLANFVFVNGGEIPDISKRAKSKEPSEAEKALETERAAYRQEKFNAALNEVGSSAAEDIEKIIKLKMDGLSLFEQKAIIKEAKAEIDSTLGKDQTFQKTLKGLWARAAESGYSSESKSRIKRAWLDRAKLIAPGIRNRLRQEALGAKKPAKSDSKLNGDQKRSFVGTGARTGSKPSGFSNPKKIDWGKTSDRDILDS